MTSLVYYFGYDALKPYTVCLPLNHIFRPVLLFLYLLLTVHVHTWDLLIIAIPENEGEVGGGINPYL